MPIYEYRCSSCGRELESMQKHSDPVLTQCPQCREADAGKASLRRRLPAEGPTAGAFTIFDTGRDMFEVARNYTQFFAHESCGFCTPCRVGTSMLLGSMEKIRGGNGTLHDLREIARLNKVLLMSAHCGLGHTACNPILDTMKKFRPMYERRLRSRDFAPAFDLDQALARARQMTGRDDAGTHLENQP